MMIPLLKGQVVESHHPHDGGHVFGQRFLPHPQVAGTVGRVCDVIKPAARPIQKPLQQRAGRPLGRLPVAVPCRRRRYGVVPVQRRHQKMRPVSQQAAVIRPDAAGRRKDMAQPPRLRHRRQVIQQPGCNFANLRPLQPPRRREQQRCRLRRKRRVAIRVNRRRRLQRPQRGRLAEIIGMRPLAAPYAHRRRVIQRSNQIINGPPRNPAVIGPL